MEERHAAELDQITEDIWADIELYKARAAVANTKKYEEAGALLRANARRLRQEQHCVICGFLFNYIDGRLLSEREWCDPRTKYCKPGIGNSFCVTLQETIDTARKRKKAGTKAKKPCRQTGTTNGHHLGLPSRNEKDF